MISKIVLCAFANRLTAGFWRFGRLVSCEVFHNDAQGLRDFREFLHRHQRTPIFLIVDAMEEDYRIETAPHTSGKTRRRLLERKLGQIYRNSQYRAAQYVGRGLERRRDDIFLCVALSNAQSFHPWIRVMSEQHALLAGVCLLSMVSQLLVRRLKLNEPHLLLTDVQVFGLRQSYFHHGQLRFSRLVPDSAPSDAGYVQFCLAETEKTRRYLLSQHLMTPDTKPCLLVLMNSDAGKEFCHSVGRESAMKCLTLAPGLLASDIGIEGTALRQFPELLYMQMVAVGGPVTSLASTAQIRDYLVHRLRNWIGGMAAGLLFVGLVLSILSVMITRDYRMQFTGARLRTIEFERRYDEAAVKLRSVPLSDADFKVAVQLPAIVVNQRTPQRLMEVVAAALDMTPEIRLQHLRWVLINDLNEDALREHGSVEGEIINSSADYQAQLDSVNRLVELIRNDARVESIVVERQPANVSVNSEQRTGMPAALFKLKLILKPVVKP